MPTQVQFRRGTTAQNNNFTGAAGELSVNTSNSSIRVHDGSTAGGFELANMNRSLRQFASTTSDELRSVLSDETGTGNAVFSLSPTIQSPTVETSIVAGNTTFNLVNTTATTVNFAGAATTLEIGAATGLTNINNNLEVDGDIQIDGGDLTFNTSTANIVNATSTTVNFAGAATTLSIGAVSGTTTVNNNLTVASNSLASNGIVTNSFTAGTLQTSGNVNGNNGNFVTALSAGTLQSTGNINAAAGLTTGNFTAANLLTSGNLDAAAALVSGNFNATGNINGTDGRFSTALTAATLQASGNVNAAAGRIAGNFSTTGVLSVSDTTAATGLNTGAAIISGGASIGGNLYVGGNLFISGTTTTLNSNVTILDDPILYLADNSTSDVLDIGLVGTFNNGTQQHGGFVRDATDGVWKIFSNVVPEPNINGTVDFTSATYDAVRMGALTATSGTFSSTISATSSNVNASSALFTGSVTGGTLQTTGNVNGNNGNFSTALSAATLQSTGNLNAAAGLISGNFNATGAVNAASMRVGSSGLTLLGATSGTIALQPTSTAGTTTITLPATTGTVVTTGDTGSVTSTMIADGTIVNADINASAAIAVSKLAASTISGITLGNNLNGLTAGTGLSGTAYNGSAAQTWTLATSGVTASTYGGAGTVPVYTVDTYGRLTSASNVAIAGSLTGITGVGTISTGTWQGSSISTTYTDAKLTSVSATSPIATSASTGAITLSHASSGVTAATYGSAGIVPVYTVNATGHITSASNVTIGGSLTGITGVGTITTGTWNGSSISTSYTDAKVTAVNAGTGISVNQTTGSLTVTNSGVTSLVAGTNISISGSTGAVTVNVSGTVSAATSATNATNTAITDDTSTNSTHYPTYVSATSGNAGQKTSSSKFTFNPSSGLLTSTDYNSSSDKRLKTNIKTVESALDKVNSLRGVTFKWKEGGNEAIGLIAQEVQKVIPEVVTKDDSGYLGIRYTNIIGVLVEAIKEQQDQINTLKKQIEKLNG